jgi:integrator complex subunit 2
LPEVYHSTFLQGYPLELLGVTVAGVPSMHICLDFAPELLSQPSLEKQASILTMVTVAFPRLTDLRLK